MERMKDTAIHVMGEDFIAKRIRNASRGGGNVTGNRIAKVMKMKGNVSAF